MSRCARARELFGPYWDDETTKAEREWLDAHFAGCPGCRSEYDALARTLTAVAGLPREEAAPDLAERALAAARRATPAPDRVLVRETPRWAPVAVTAVFLLLAGMALAPYLVRLPGAPATANRDAPVAEPRLVSAATPSAPASGSAPASPPASAGTATSISESLFDHSEDVDFVLDPVTLRRGRAHTTSRPTGEIRGDQAVITF